VKNQAITLVRAVWFVGESKTFFVKQACLYKTNKTTNLFMTT